MKKINLKYLTNCFYKGKYKDVILELGNSQHLSTHPQFEEFKFLQVSSLVFTGEFEDARILFETSLSQQSSLLFLSRCRFFLGIGCVRKSDYSKAAKYFSANLFAVRRLKFDDQNQESFFYAHQGSAFFRFYRGQFELSKKSAFKSYEAAIKSNFKYGQVLALDLLGHSLCETGHIHRGLRELNKAYQLANEVDSGSIITAIEISTLIYKARFGIERKTILAKLKKAIQMHSPEDTYSRTSLYLELSRQLILRGQASEAYAELIKASESVYQFQNIRQSAVYNLRHAYLLFIKGELHAARVLANSLRMNLNTRVDRAIICQVEGLLEDINYKLTGQKYLKRSNQALIGSTEYRIRQRKSGNSSEVLKGEDPLGDLIDRIEIEGELIYQEVKNEGLLGLVPKIFKFPVTSTLIYFGPTNSEIILASHGDIISIDKNITQPMKKLIHLLQGNEFKSKEYLIQAVWGYSYDPILHDKLLHATIGKIRKIFGKYAFWVEWQNQGYRLLPAIQVLVPNEVQSDINVISHFNQKIILSPEKRNEIKSVELNLRQLRVLQFMRSGDFIGVKEYAKRNKICKMTACRDLSNLHTGGHVIKVGRGRSTVYGLFKD
jgi:hypothetical protein